jgi:hypothetical protein
MKLEYGKRYVRRDGVVTGPLELNDYTGTRYPFKDPIRDLNYPPSGDWYVDSPREDSLDLVHEYKEATNSRHTLDMCDALNTRIDQYDSTPEAKRLVLLAEMLEYCLAIHETATVESTKAQAKETGVTVAEELRCLVSDKCDVVFELFTY